MRPIVPNTKDTAELFRSRLENIIDMRHELVKLAQKLDWQRIDSHFAGFYSENGRPGLAIARTIITAHHGQIWAENNQAAVGSTFLFWVPREWPQR